MEDEGTKDNHLQPLYGYIHKKTGTNVIEFCVR